MNSSRNGINNAWRYFCILVVIVFGFVAIIGSSGSSSGDGDSDGVVDDGNDGDTTGTPETFTASGTYTYNSGTGELTADFTSSDFTGCGPELGISIFNVDSITATSMVWGEGTEDELTWSRDSSTAGNEVGTWNMDDNDGNSYELNLNSDGSMLLTGEIVECGDDGGSGDGDGGSGDGGDTTETPETYTASGTYSYNSGTGELTANFTSSDFTDCGPPLGTSVFNVDSITATNMIWDEGTEDELTWSRDSGTAGNIVGTWEMTENDGNSYELILNSDGSMLLTGEIVSCNSEGSGDGDSGSGGGDGGGSQSLTITGESGNPVNMDGTWESGCNYNSNDDETRMTTITVSESTFTQTDEIWFGTSDCSGLSDATITANGSTSLGDEVTASKDGSNVTATKADVNFSSYTGTINNAALISNFNADGVCGFNDWVVDTPKDLIGTDCGPDTASIKDIFYIDDTANPDAWYGGDGYGPTDANDYPTQIELSSAKERT